MNALNNREKTILKSLVQLFIHTAAPVGSTRVAQVSRTGLRSASVRRVMSALEEKGFVAQPHVSAGRVPTTDGYRYYVNELLEMNRLSNRVKKEIVLAVDTYDGNIEALFSRVSLALSKISQQLSIVLTPKTQQVTFERFQIISIRPDKMMVVLSAGNAYVRTTLIDVQKGFRLARAQQILKTVNALLDGKTLSEAQNRMRIFVSRIKEEPKEITSFFEKLEQQIFNQNRLDNFSLAGTKNILTQPEFSDVNRVSSLVDLLEDREILVHFMEQREIPPGIRVTIGEEHTEKRIRLCSVITSTYSVGPVSGILGVIGPTRIPYRNVIPLVDFTARAISKKLNIN